MTSQLGFRPTDVELANRRSARLALARILTTLAGLAIVVLNISCAEDKASSTAPATQIAIREYAQHIRAVLPKGWSTQANKDIVVVRREKPVEWYGTISLPVHRKADLKAMGFVHSGVYSIKIRFAPPMSEAEAAKLAQENRRTAERYYRKHPVSAKTKPSAPPEELTAALHPIPDILSKKCSIFLYVFIGPGTAFYNKADEVECRKVERAVLKILKDNGVEGRKSLTPATTQPGSSRTQPSRRELSILNFIELVDKDDVPAGMHCRVPTYIRKDFPSPKWVYQHTIDAIKRAGAGPDVLILPELSARLEGTYTAKGTMEVAEQFVQGDTITICLRYIDEERDISKSSLVRVEGDKQVKSVYLWGNMPNDLPPGRYTVNLKLDEYLRQDGQLIFAPKTKIRHFERLTCTFTVPLVTTTAPATTQPDSSRTQPGIIRVDVSADGRFCVNKKWAADKAGLIALLKKVGIKKGQVVEVWPDAKADWRAVRKARLTAIYAGGVSQVNIMPADGPFAYLQKARSVDCPRLPDDRKVLVEADSLAKLTAKVKPDATWDDIKFLWAEKDNAGKLQFRLNEAYIYEPQGKKARWVLLNRTKGGSSGGYIRAVAPLVKKIPVHDSGPGNYAIVLATDPKGGTLYQLGWESELGGAGGSYSDRQFYVLHDRQGRWRFVGQFSERSNGWREGNRCISTSYKTGKVEWTGDDKAPVRLRFRQAVTYFDGARYSEDEVNLPGLPEQTTYRDGVFEGKLPARVKWLAPR